MCGICGRIDPAGVREGDLDATFARLEAEALQQKPGAHGLLALDWHNGNRTILVDPLLSGAVFGDHCSPLSDTTIVSSIACEIEPLEHVRTQLPYALLAAAAAVVIGFLPAGFGVPAWLLLPAGFGALALLPAVLRGGRIA